MIQEFTEAEIRSLRKLIESSEHVERILKILIDEREEIRSLVQQCDENNRKVTGILPTLEKLVENKERIDWFWSTSRKYGGGALALIILISTFQEHANKILMWLRSFLRGP